jgi:hypothetical protein
LLFCGCTRWLFDKINEIRGHLPKVKLPGWLGGVEISVANLCQIGFFHYHPDVLDAWVSKHIAAAEDQFGKVATVLQREVHVEVPVELDLTVIPGLKAEDLKAPLARICACLLIWGEGGRWRDELSLSNRPLGHVG